MKNLKLLSAILIVSVFNSCLEDPVNQEALKGSISLNVEVSMRINEVHGKMSNISPDTLNVDVYTIENALVHSFENVLDFPSELELMPGSYYVEVYSDNVRPAAWDNPMVYGHSGNFIVEAGMSTSVGVNCALTNVKITVGYTQAVKDNFSAYYTDVVSPDGSLRYEMDELRSGHFIPGPLTIESFLTFVTSDETRIEKKITGLIEYALAGTYYNIMIDADIPEGKIRMTVNIDETYVEEMITFSEEPEIPEGPLGYGSLLITEIMYNPTALSDTEGEWFEIYNAGSEPQDLLNMVVRKEAGLAFVVDTQFILNPGEYLVFAKTAGATLEADYIYGSAMNLTNSGDKIVLANYGTDGNDGSVISEVDYGNGTGFPSATGASINLDPMAYDVESAKSGSNWCLSTESFETGDLGTPGIENTPCN